MAINIVQQTHTDLGGASGTTALPVSFATLPGVGNAVIAGLSIRGTGTTIVSVADNQGGGNVFSSVITATDSFSSLTFLQWCPVILTPSGTYTLTWNISATGGSNNGGQILSLLEVSGLSGLVDQTGGSFAGGVTSETTSCSSANSNANDLVVSIIGMSNFGANGISDPASVGYTSWYVDQGTNTGQVGMAGSYKVVSALETSSSSWSWTGGASAYSSVIATFKAGIVSGNSASIAWVT